MTRHCLKCGKGFNPSRDSHVYCCERCRKHAEKARWRKSHAEKAQKRLGLIMTSAGTEKTPPEAELRAAERAAKAKARQEARDARILAARRKRRLMQEESLKDRVANAERYAAMRSASMERAMIGRRKRAEAQIAAAIERGKAAEEAAVAKALAEGGEVSYGICRGCGRDFKFVQNPNKAAPEYCCKSCKSHAKYVADRDKYLEYGKRYREEKKAGKREQKRLATHYRGSGFYCHTAGGSLSFFEDMALDAMMEQPFSEEAFDR